MQRFIIALSMACAFSACAGFATSQSLRVTSGDAGLTSRLNGEALVLDVQDGARSDDFVAAAKGDYARLVAVLYEEGFFSPVVSIKLAGQEASGLSTFRPPALVTPVEILVEPGPRFRFGQAQIGPLAPKASAASGFAPGAVAGTGQIRAAASKALDEWREASHAKAQISGQQITARHADQRLDVVLSVDPGPALTFGKLLVGDAEGYNPERLRQIAGFPSGQGYTPKAVRDARARLVATGAFSSVVLKEQGIPNADDTLDYALDLEAAAARRVGFGAQLESNAGFSLEAFWLHRNALGGAERLRFDAEVEGIGGDSGGIDYNLGTSLSVPGFRRSDDTLELFATLERLDEVAFTSQLFEMGARRERQVDEDLAIGVMIGLRASETTDSFGTRQFRHLILAVDAERDRRNDPLNPTDGTFAAIEIKPFVGLDGSATGARVSADLRAYRSFGDDLVAAGRLQFGGVYGAEISDTPPEFLFFSGGGGSVRGQGYQSLGVDQAGSTVGGRGFAGLSMELRQDIGRNLTMVGFADFGFISEGGDLKNGKSHAGAGLGLRYNTPLGPIRLDVGVPVGNASDPGMSYGIYIGLGQAF